MFRSLLISGLVVCLGLLLALSPILMAATPEQRKQLAQIDTALSQAEKLLKDGKAKEAGDQVKDAQAKAEKLAASGDKTIASNLESIYSKLEKAHALLALEGIDLPDLKKPMPKGTETKSPNTPAGAVSFSKDVAPIIISRCGNCHVRQARGQVSMSSFENLMRGKPGVDGFVIPKEPAASFLIGVIEDARMPPSGNKLPDNEIGILKKWIMDGATFDGKDPKELLTSIAPNVKQITAGNVELAMATGKEKISFANDIAPMLAESCYGCHGGGDQVRGNFNLATFAGMLRAGDTDKPFVPGKSAESLIIKKLKGTGAGARMPERRPKWSDEQIAKVALWIDEGAKFDGISPRATVRRVAAVAKALRSNHEQLTAARKELAEENWRLGSPGIKASVVESTNFLVMGDVGDNTLKDIGEKAEALTPKIATYFKADSDKALIKGRFTLFVFSERYGYSEFGKMVEKRDLPREWRGHWEFDITDAYGAIFPSRTNDVSLDGLIVQQLAGSYAASLDPTVPRWFSEGSGRVVAAKLSPADVRIKNWNASLMPSVATLKKADDFMNDEFTTEANDVCAYSFCNMMMSDLKRYHHLIEDLRNHVNFEKAFTSSYGTTPKQAAEGWVKRPSTVAPTKGPVVKNKKT